MNKKILVETNSKSNVFDLKKLTWSQLIFTFLLVTVVQTAVPHGSVTSPPSRVWICFQENPESPDSPACIAAVASHGTQALYDWPAILQPNANSNHQQYVMDGNLASGGDPDKYGGMDQVRDDWIATEVTPGPYTITWTITAPHATLYYDVYITKEDWTPNQPLTWDSLELLVRTGERPLSTSDDIDVVLPQRTGRHVIYSVWQRSLSQEAFYSTSDVDFGDTLSIEDYEEASLDFNLKQNYPNPFSSMSDIEFRLGKEAFVSLKVYDIFGKEISTLVNELHPPGEYKITFNGESLSSGMYFYVFQAGDFIQARRMVLQ